MGDDPPRLELTAVKIRGTNGEFCLRATINERHGVPVRLSLISWEPLFPGPSPRDGTACRRLNVEIESSVRFFQPTPR